MIWVIHVSEISLIYSTRPIVCALLLLAIDRDFVTFQIEHDAPSLN
jgi:hypothetical protein